MKTHSPQNERVKRAYFTYLAEAQGFSEPTLDAVAKAINRFETYTRFRDFKAFHIEQAKGFKASLAGQMSLRSGDHLSKATLYATLSALKRFFIWLAGLPGYKSRISYSDAEYFNLSAKETRVAKARREERVPTLEQVRHVIHMMPASTEIERRDQALIAFTILTGARDRATASLKLKHIDAHQGRVNQDARQVNTKFSKTFTTWFFPVGDDVLQIIVDWVNYLRQEKLWSADDPLFPATKIVVGASRHFEVSGLDRKHWSSAGPIRKIFEVAFAGAGLPYFNPHSFRKTLAQLGEKVCRTPEQFKAWSQNLGHEKVLTTFSSYGEVAAERQRDIIRELAQPRKPDPQFQEILKQLMWATQCTAAEWEKGTSASEAVKAIKEIKARKT
jgi:integrase